MVEEGTGLQMLVDSREDSRRPQRMTAEATGWEFQKESK